MHKVGKSNTPSFVKFPASIPGQFILLDAADRDALGPNPLREGWQSHEIGGVYLLAAPGVRIVPCRLPDGATAGFFIGEPADVDAGAIVRQELTIANAPADMEDVDRWVEDEVYRFGGRFMFVLTFGGLRRVYLDADGFLPLVYDPHLRIAGATAAAVYARDEFEQKFDAELFKRMNLFAGGWFPAGLTAHRGLSRLMCNFYLDLTDWTAHRHWPTGDLAYVDEPVEAMAELAESIRKGIATYFAAAPCCMALTGGNESRLLLSLVRDLAQSIQFVCWYDEQGARDRVISQRLARLFGLNVRYETFPVVSDDEANEWMARTGYCAAENRYRYKVAAYISEFEYLVGGLGGEIGRGFFWRPTDGADPVTATDIYTRLALPAHPRAEKAVADWFDTLPTTEPLLQLDLAYLEVRMSCWAAVQAYATVGPRLVYPMTSRDTYTRMLKLPPEWRRGNRWLLAIIESNWPELLSVPINHLGRIRETLRSLQRAIRQPTLITRRLKRRFG